MPMSATLAERIDHLFRNQLSPRGREYTYREVAAAVTGRNGTTFSPAYLWQLRTGAKDNPTMRHLEALARFFQVSPSYFFDDELTEFPDTEVRQLVASRNETLRQMTVTLLGLSDESLNAVLNLACRLRQLEGLPSPD
ncbi:MAG: XRE family transcriptional regulator [Dehalococcoidia bacterium]|nr:XRE family transcriptional regulator [Dehalococcoidia bacterium]